MYKQHRFYTFNIKNTFFTSNKYEDYAEFYKQQAQSTDTINNLFYNAGYCEKLRKALHS